MPTFDLKDADVRELNHALHHEASAGAEFKVINPNGKHSVAVGAIYSTQINIEGHVGYYCAGMNQQATVTVHGNAGSGCAENMMSGQVRVKGNASQYCGATAHGGLLVVEGDTAARCGISMKGIDIVIGGSVGNMSAFMAQSGRLVICGDAGEALGDSMYEARIYVGGKVASLGADCIEKPIKSEHEAELKDLLGQAGIDAGDISRFRRYGSARKLYNFNIDHAGEY